MSEAVHRKYIINKKWQIDQTVRGLFAIWGSQLLIFSLMQLLVPKNMEPVLSVQIQSKLKIFLVYREFLLSYTSKLQQSPLLSTKTEYA